MCTGFLIEIFFYFCKEYIENLTLVRDVYWEFKESLQTSSSSKPATRGAHYTEIELFSTMWKYNFEMYVTSNN